MGRVVWSLLSSAVLMAGPVGTWSGPRSIGACYEPPVDGRIVEAFRAPACPYCPGQRGIEFDARPGEPVRAAASGVVTFAGAVAGTRYVVIGLDDGRRATYGRISSGRVVLGQRVRAGQVLAVAGSQGLYFGLREGERYVDPAPFLGRRRFPVRLVPVDGGARPSAVPGRLVCPMESGSR